MESARIVDSPVSLYTQRHGKYCQGVLAFTSDITSNVGNLLVQGADMDFEMVTISQKIPEIKQKFFISAAEQENGVVQDQFPYKYKVNMDTNWCEDAVYTCFIPKFVM